MTVRDAGMTVRDTGMTVRDTGMTVRDTGMTMVGAEMLEWHVAVIPVRSISLKCWVIFRTGISCTTLLRRS